MNAKGTNIQANKQRNKLLVFQLICTHSTISRKEIADKTGLTRMAVGNLVAELIADGLVIETASDSDDRLASQFGRKPINLNLSSSSPCICGILIKRGVFHFIVGSLDGKIQNSVVYKFDTLRDKDEMLDLLYHGYQEVLANCNRKIIAIGISSVGPLNADQGIILRPPFFYGIHDINITSFFKEKTNLPVYLINDANAGALAEILYGSMKNRSNFLYLHLMNGIGAGIVINGHLYDGDNGQSGELGHMSINCAGPLCDCGNKGCLELYANNENICQFIRSRKHIFPDAPIAQIAQPSWLDIIKEAGMQDPLALMSLDEYCDYLSFALISSLKLLNLSTIVMGYENIGTQYPLEHILSGKLSNPSMCNTASEITILHSYFGENAPLIGSIALIADKIFHGEFMI